ncbi:hypothetical protein NQZ68_014334 [Dissostichus eleginoides]|nr:hypothetical protein NQZ68_014334 [Dissostichus eleginoides]
MGLGHQALQLLQSLKSTSGGLLSITKSKLCSFSVAAPIPSPKISSLLEFPLESLFKSPLESPLKSPLKSLFESPLESLFKSPLESPLKSLLESPHKFPLESPLESPFKSPLEFVFPVLRNVCSERPLAQTQWTVLTGGTGAELGASHSSRGSKQHGREEPCLHGPEEVHRTPQQEQRERTVISLLLRKL